MDTKQSQSRWVFLARPTKGEHRFFRDSHRAPGLRREIAIADNSGATPDSTDDGPLFLDDTRDCEVDIDQHGARVHFPVCKERDVMGQSWMQSWTGLTIADLMWLLREGHWSVNRVRMTDVVHALVDLGTIVRSGVEIDRSGT